MTKYILKNEQFNKVVYKFIDLVLPHVCEGKNWVYFSPGENSEYSQLSLLKTAGILYISKDLLSKIENQFNMPRLLAFQLVIKYVRNYYTFDEPSIENPKARLFMKYEICTPQ